MKPIVDDHRIDVFEAIVLTFTIYIITSIIWQMFLPVDSEVAKLLIFFDMVSCVIFIIDWVKRYRMAEKKWKYSLINSLDLLASFPFLFTSQYVQFIRFVRLLRVIKIIGGINRIVYYLSTNKIYAGKLLFSITFMLIMIISPIMILYVEEGVGNIKTAEQALWWSYCTLSTIGYGDFYPVTKVGRILAVFVSAGGISLFGLLSGLIIERFVNNHKNEEDTNKSES